MTFHFSAYVADKPDSELIKQTLNYPNLTANEVRIAITHCGVCRSDLHFMQNSWGDSSYPMVPGHEIVGTITELGSSVMDLAIGQRVGVSWQVGACGHCRWCKMQHEEFCPKIQGISINHYGGFASHIQLPADYVYLIPKELNSADAAPLFCAGATAYNALKTSQVKVGMQVAILGVGGIGHLAVQFAKAMGAEVTALINDLSRADEIKAMGAQAVYLSDDLAIYPKLQEQFDVIITTLDNELDYAPFINMLAPYGTLCFIGIPAKPLQFSIFQLVIGQKKIVAVPLGSRRHIKEVLEFAALYKIKPHIELLPMSQVNHALQKLEQGEAHYRIVLYEKF